MEQISRIRERDIHVWKDLFHLAIEEVLPETGFPKVRIELRNPASQLQNNLHTYASKKVYGKILERLYLELDKPGGIMLIEADINYVTISVVRNYYMKDAASILFTIAIKSIVEVERELAQKG